MKTQENQFSLFFFVTYTFNLLKNHDIVIRKRRGETRITIEAKEGPVYKDKASREKLAPGSRGLQ